VNCFALDLGTTTGYALHRDGESFVAGSWCLANDAVIKLNKQQRVDRRLDPRVPLLFETVVRHIKQYDIKWIFFEDVQFGKTLGQVQLWSSFRGAVWCAAWQCGVKTECCPVGTLKKSASGFGGSDKDGMAYALAKSDKRFKLVGKKLTDTLSGRILDDNAVDAIHLLKWGLNLTKNCK